MTINTKFDLEDEAYILRENKIVRVTIVGYSFSTVTNSTVKRDITTTEMYEVMNKDGSLSLKLYANSLYKTANELIEKLMSNII